MKKIVLFSLVGLIALTSACRKTKKASMDEERVIYVDNNKEITSERTSGPDSWPTESLK